MTEMVGLREPIVGLGHLLITPVKRPALKQIHWGNQAHNDKA
jgi:hypothetical protein